MATAAQLSEEVGAMSLRTPEEVSKMIEDALKSIKVKVGKANR